MFVFQAGKFIQNEIFETIGDFIWIELKLLIKFMVVSCQMFSDVLQITEPDLMYVIYIMCVLSRICSCVL